MTSSTRLFRPARVHAAFVLVASVAVLFLGIATSASAVPAEPTENDVEVDSIATASLIEATRNTDELCAHFEDLLGSFPSRRKRLDDVALGQEFSRRFYSSWPYRDPFGTDPWNSPLPNPRIQAMCWLAECNKRMCVDMPEARNRQRKAILTSVKQGLAITSDPEEMKGFLRVAYRTVFYPLPIVPTEGADEVIDLFKRYVGNRDPLVHEFARDRLRCMGSVWSPRAEEIMQFLIVKAPEIKEYLTAEPVPGFPLDPLTFCREWIRKMNEADWLSLNEKPAEALASIVEQTLSSERSQDMMGERAFSYLLRKGLKEDGDAGFQALIELVRKGIRASHIVYCYAMWAASGSYEMPPELMKERFGALLTAFEGLAQSDAWPPDEPEPARRLENILEAVRKSEEKSVLKPHVETQLSEALSRLSDAYPSDGAGR